MKTVVCNRLLGFLIATCSAVLLWRSGAALLAGDGCNDSGGSFNYLVLACDFQHDHESYFVFALVVGPLALLMTLFGAVLMARREIQAP